jgi:hypothetical protein
MQEKRCFSHSLGCYSMLNVRANLQRLQSAQKYLLIFVFSDNLYYFCIKMMECARKGLLQPDMNLL